MDVRCQTYMLRPSDRQLVVRPKYRQRNEVKKYLNFSNFSSNPMTILTFFTILRIHAIKNFLHFSSHIFFFYDKFYIFV